MFASVQDGENSSIASQQSTRRTSDNEKSQRYRSGYSFTVVGTVYIYIYMRVFVRFRE